MGVAHAYDVRVNAPHTSLTSRRVYGWAGYRSQIVCDEGYSIYEITIKMGGVDITSTAYDPTYNMISIPSVTGDVDIECYAMHSIPSDYIRVDGIKNPSNAYLNTGYSINNNNKVSIKFHSSLQSGISYPASSKDTGMSTTNGAGWWGNTSNGNFYAFYAKTSAYIGTFYDASTYECIADYYKGTHLRILNGNSRTDNMTKSTWSSGYNFCLFSRNQGYNSDKTAGQIVYYFHIYDYSTTSYVRYYIPCLNDSGVAGYWDAARGVFQGSSNSTAFQPVYVQDNLIAHYDGIDNAGVGVHDASATTWKDLKGSNDVVAIEETVTWESDGWISNTGSVHFWTNGNSFIISSLYDSDFTLEYVFRPYGMNANSGQYSLSSNRTSTDLTNYLAVSQKDLISIHAHRAGINTARNLIANNGVYSVSAVKKGNLYSVWINGIKVASGISTGSAAFYSINSYLIGGDANGNFKGKYFAHRVYTKALTDEEIIGNYNIDKLRFNF